MKRVNIAFSENGTAISKNIYGHFIEQTGRTVYDGVFVGKNSPIPNRDGVRLDVINAWREMGVPLLHWPGGFTSEGYDWRRGIGKNRQCDPQMPSNMMVQDSNEFGTHEFFDLCEYLGCDSYLVCGVSHETLADVRDWIRYITAETDCEMVRLRRANGREKPWKLNYLCIGNEWWYFSDERQYAADYRKFKFAAGNGTDHPDFKIAFRGPHIWKPEITKILHGELGKTAHPLMGMYLLMKPTPQGVSGKLDRAQAESLFAALPEIDRLLKHHAEILRADGNENARIALDEWETWYENVPGVLWEQETTMLDALVAAGVLNLLNNRADLVEVACVTMSVNVLMCPLKTKGEKFLKTPVFDVFKMYKGHQNASLLNAEKTGDETAENGVEKLSVSASKKDGKVLVTLSNFSPDEPFEITLNFQGEISDISAECLCAEPDDFNTFEEPDKVRCHPATEFSVYKTALRITLPPSSVVSVTAEEK